MVHLKADMVWSQLVVAEEDKDKDFPILPLIQLELLVVADQVLSLLNILLNAIILTSDLYYDNQNVLSQVVLSWDSANQESKRIRSIFSDYISDDSNYLTPSGWQCNVLSTYGHDNNPNAPWDEFANEIEPCMIEFLKEMYPKKEPLMSPTEIWVNKYKKGGFQENHDHVLSPNHEHFCNLSFIYFYQVNDSNFEFYNREYSEYIKSGLDDVFRVSVERFTSPQVKTGDVIIFSINS